MLERHKPHLANVDSPGDERLHARLANPPIFGVATFGPEKIEKQA